MASSKRAQSFTMQFFLVCIRRILSQKRATRAPCAGATGCNSVDNILHFSSDVGKSDASDVRHPMRIILGAKKKPSGTFHAKSQDGVGFCNTVADQKPWPKTVLSFNFARFWLVEGKVQTVCMHGLFGTVLSENPYWIIEFLFLALVRNT